VVDISNYYAPLFCFLELSEILEKHTFVGIVDTHKCLSLVQYSTNLYLVNHSSLAYVVVIPAHVSVSIDVVYLGKSCSINSDYDNLGISVK